MNTFVRVRALALVLSLGACSRAPHEGEPMKRVLPSGARVEATADERAQMEHSLDELKAPGARVVYPVLTAYDWSAKPYAVFKHFLDKDKPPVPLIAYGYNTSQSYVFVTKDELGARTLDSLHEEAMANLERVAIAWEPIDDNTLTASGHDFSAEKTLCPDFVIAAEKKLRAKSVLISTPRRRVAYAFNAAAPKEKRDLFFAVVAHTLADDSFGNALITNLVFEYEGDKVVRAFTVSGGQ